MQCLQTVYHRLNMIVMQEDPDKRNFSEEKATKIRLLCPETTEGGYILYHTKVFLKWSVDFQKQQLKKEKNYLGSWIDAIPLRI